MKLESIYYTLGDPIAYSGSEYKIAKKYSEEDLEWLKKQDAFTLHRQVRKKFPRRSYHVSNFNDLWEVDLMDLRSLASENNGYTFVLVVIDVLSKYAFAEPLEKKNATCVCEGFKKILERAEGRLPITLQSDRGKEFTNKSFQTLLKKNNILFKIAPSPDVKAACAERLIRTLKTRLWRYFTHRNTRRYVDVIQDIVKSYNNTVHSSTKMQPACVNLYNAAEARENIEKRNSALIPKRSQKPKYKVGTLVRISRSPNIFRKGYERGWTEEIFEITRVSSARQPHLYYLKDSNNELIEGFFYPEELSPVRTERFEESQPGEENDNGDSQLFEIEKVIRTRGRGEKKELFVRWKNYSSKFNCWIPANSVVDIST